MLTWQLKTSDSLTGLVLLIHHIFMISVCFAHIHTSSGVNLVAASCWLGSVQMEINHQVNDLWTWRIKSANWGPTAAQLNGRQSVCNQLVSVVLYRSLQLPVQLSLTFFSSHSRSICSQQKNAHHNLWCAQFRTCIFPSQRSPTACSWIQRLLTLENSVFSSSFLKWSTCVGVKWNNCSWELREESYTQFWLLWFQDAKSPGELHNGNNNYSDWNKK